MTDRQRFESLIGFVLAHEGGLSEDPVDPGGITHWGISLRSYPKLGPDGIRNLTVEQARDIYYRDWWLPLRCPQIHDDKVAQKYMDTCINVGRDAGTRILQRAVAWAGHPVTVDGGIGPKTIAAVNASEPQELLAAMRLYQAEHYDRLIRKNPALAKFQRGWMARANS